MIGDAFRVREFSSQSHHVSRAEAGKDLQVKDPFAWAKLMRLCPSTRQVSGEAHRIHHDRVHLPHIEAMLGYAPASLTHACDHRRLLNALLHR